MFSIKVSFNAIRQSKSIKRKLAIIAGILIALVLSLLLTGFIYETIAASNETKKFKPYGEFIDVNGRNLHVTVTGEAQEGIPPVIIEAGTGNWSYDWLQVQQKIAKYTQVITYDRAGSGWSDPNPFTPTNVVDDLHNIVNKKHIQQPFILVGHSAGGLYTRLYADKYPNSVAGMILVDARPENFTEMFPEFNAKFFETQDQSMNKFLARISIVRLIGKNVLPPNLPEELSKDTYVNVHWDYNFFNVLDQEIKQMTLTEKQLINAQSLGNKPLIVITANKNYIDAVSLGFTKQQEQEINEKWFELQKKLTTLSTNSEQVLTSNSSHAVMYDEPELIVDSVKNMIEKIRAE